MLPLLQKKIKDMLNKIYEALFQSLFYKQFKDVERLPQQIYALVNL